MIVSCKKSHDAPDAPPITEPFSETFDGVVLAPHWHPTAGNYHVKDGALSAKGAYNHPLWLMRKLPAAVSIEFDAWSGSPEGDIKVEFFGDGRSFARDKGQYTSTGYVAVLGGWSNTLSILAKGNEHGVELVKRKLPKVALGHRYHWKIVRANQNIAWYVDDMTTPFLTLADPSPLGGDRHSFFAINNWESDSWFDNLNITPL